MQNKDPGSDFVIHLGGAFKISVETDSNMSAASLVDLVMSRDAIDEPTAVDVAGKRSSPLPPPGRDNPEKLLRWVRWQIVVPRSEADQTGDTVAEGR